MPTRWLTYPRVAKIVLVVVAPIAMYLGLRRHNGSKPRAAVWVELLGAPHGGRYQPRTSVFDAARRRVTTGAARGETTVLVLRVTADQAVEKVQVTAGELRSRYQRRPDLVVRAFFEVGGALIPAAPVDIEAGKSRTWLLEIEVGGKSAPGLFSGGLSVEAAGGDLAQLQLRVRVHPFQLGPARVKAVARPPASASERALLGRLGIQVGTPPPGSLQAGSQPRRAAWRAVAGAAPALDLGPASALVHSADGTTSPRPRAWLVRRGLQDLSYLDILRGRRDPLASGLIARMTAGPLPDASAWEQARRELAGLLKAPNRREH